jgi:PAP2 superfamily
VRVGGPADLGWPAGLRLARQEGWFGERLAVFAASIVILPLFFWAFAAWKMWVPPFTWDAELAVLDRALHGGDPYTLIPQSPRLAWLMDRFYWSWNYLFVGVMVWQVWAGSPAERARFWLAFVLMWIGLGTVLAHLFSSAGPCFYPQLTGGPGPYGPLLSNLEAADRQYGLHLFGIREYLWRTVHSQEVVLGGGISAFPSLHVAPPTLAACAAWRVSPWLAAGFGIYTAALTVCSVGWAGTTQLTPS